MPLSEQIQNIINVTILIGVLFTVYKSFRTPQEKTERQDAVFAEQMKALRLEFTNLKDNHIHTLDVKLDGAISSINSQAVEIAKLSTIINERIPPRK